LDKNRRRLHINTDTIKQDINVMLPLARFQEFEKEGIIGKLAPTCYSCYGFQLARTTEADRLAPTGDVPHNKIAFS
jgi:hypothetical protein